MKRCLSLFVGMLLSLVFLPLSSNAYFVGPPLTLAQIASQSDLIVKATVISSGEARDSWLGTMSDAVVEATQMKVVSVIKGPRPAGIITFRHYIKAQTLRYISMGPGPQCYQLEVGRTYIVFAKATISPHVYRQLWKTPLGLKNDQGVLLCADATPLAGQNLHGIFWTELTGLLQSHISDNKLYALAQLDVMSGAPHKRMTLSDFDRAQVLAAIAPLLESKDPSVVLAALPVVAGHSLYLSDEIGTRWTPRRYLFISPQDTARYPLATVLDAKPYLSRMLSLANGNSDARVRALAIRALCAADAKNIDSFVVRWAGDTQPQVRAAAALMLAKNTPPTAPDLLGTLSHDTQPAVRISVAHGIELAQTADDLPLISVLLHDPDLNVREAAASSLASFPVGQTRNILKANIADPDFKSVFLDILADDDPTPYLDGLSDVIAKRLVPPSFGGNLPAVEAWEILFKALGSQSQTSLAADKWQHYMDVLETAENWGSSDPRDLYAFYVSRHMTARARQFRQSVKKTIPYDMETYFNDVDKQAATGQ